MSAKWDDLKQILHRGMTQDEVYTLACAIPDELLSGDASQLTAELSELAGEWDGVPPLRRAFVWGRACERGLPSESKEPVSIADLAERLLRLEALFVDPRDLAKLTDDEAQEAARMPGGDLQLGRLSKIEDRLVLLEQAVARAATSVARAGITIDPLDGIDWQLKNIARVLERAAGVQELSIAIAHHRVIDDKPCVHCGCRLQYADGSGPICPGCGQARSGEPQEIATPTREPLPNGMGYPITVARGRAVGFAAGGPIGTVVIQVQAVDSLGADLTPAAIRTGWGCRCGQLYEVTGEVVTGEVVTGDDNKRLRLPTPSGNLGVAVEAIIAAEQAEREMPAGVELTPIGQAANEGLIRLRRFDGWQRKLRDTVNRLHRIGRPPDEPLGAWEHKAEPLIAEVFELLRRDLEEAAEPSTEGHRRTLVAARRLWDEAKRARGDKEPT